VDATTRALAAALRRRLDEENSTTTVADLWPALELASSGRLASWRDHAQRWRDHVGPFFGARLAACVRPGDVDEYRALRLVAGAALATVNREIALLRRLLRFSARRGTITESHLHGQGMTAELIWRERNVRRTVVEDNPAATITLGRLLAAADRRLRAFVLLLHRSGARRTEASLLRHEQIDRANLVAWIPDEDTKGGDGGRYVPLFADVIAALEEVPRVDGNPYVFATRRRWRARPADEKYQPRAEHPDAWTKRFGRLIRKLGVDGPDGPPWLHDLRRSFITLSRRRGEDTTAITKISGHKTLIAFQRYNVFSLIDVLATRSRLEAARAAELAQHRRGPRRADAPAAEAEPREGTA